MVFKRGMVVSILGCGWLGRPLARALVQQGVRVKGSTTTKEKLEALTREGIEAFWIQAPLRPGRQKSIGSFFETDTLFLNIPFRRTLPDPRFYHDQIVSVIKAVERFRVGHVVFASSTSVYPETRVKATEEMPLVPDNARAGVLKDIEEDLLRNTSFHTTVIRFAGMYDGGQRRIGRFLSGKTDKRNPESPVNLIHLEDCVGLSVKVILEEKSRGEIFNACSDGHPSRRELYVKAADVLGIPPPRFQGRSRPQGKIVSNQKVKDFFQYQFKHPDPMIF